MGEKNEKNMNMFKKPINKPIKKNNLEITNLFQYEFVQSWKNFPKCAICNHEMNASQNRTARRPLILECFHNACEKCILLNYRNYVECTQCNCKTFIDRRHPVREKIEFNYHLIGILNYIEYNLPYDLSISNTGKFSQNDNKLMMNKKQNKYECNECNVEQTNQFCIDCNVPYCTKCFQNIHKFGKILQKHTLLTVENQKKNLLINERIHKKCLKHKRYFEHYCCECKRNICRICATNEHSEHRILSIPVENQKLMPKVQSLLETVSMIKEHNKQSQKSAKFVENKYEEHASQVIEDISNYFNELHAILQVIERNTLLELKSKAMIPLQKAKSSYSTFSTTQETLDDIQNTLLDIIDDPPKSIILTKIVDNANKILQNLPCNATFDNFEENPFKFCINSKDFKNDIKNYFTLKVKPNIFDVKISTYFGNTSDFETQKINTIPYTNSSIDQRSSIHNFSIDRLSSLQSLNDYINENESVISNKKQTKNPKNVHRKKTYNLNDKTSSTLKSNYYNITENKTILSSSSFLLDQTAAKKVLISHLINPCEFYVQNNNFVKSYENLKKLYDEEANVATTPDYIDLNSIYLIFNSTDKIWYRAQVIESCENDIYKVFLIDFGNILEIPRQRFREISEKLKQDAPGAVKCSIYGIKPKNDKWSQEATFIMHDITSREIVNLLLLKEENDTKIVDIITINKYPSSLRDALIFTNFAEPVPIDEDDNLSCSIGAFEHLKKSLLSLSDLPTFFKYSFNEGENFRVSIVNIINPQQFFAAKYDHLDNIIELQNEMNNEYEKDKDKIYCPQLEMPCAIYVNENWYRARITKVLDNGECRVWLVDKGVHETISWKKIRVLDDKFLTSNEYVFQCSLTDVEPLRKHLYAWTDNAIAELRRISKNPVIQIFIHHSKEFRYKVVLYVIKKHCNVNVNALMVKYGHAVSTGNESLQVEHSKCSSGATTIIDTSMKVATSTNNKRSDISTTAQSTKSELKNKEPTPQLVEKRKIKITRIVSPGEFYIQLLDHIPAIRKLHEEIQLLQKRSENIVDLIEAKEWNLNNNCLVYTKLNFDSHLQWYRGIIVKVKYPRDDIEDNNDDNSEDNNDGNSEDDKSYTVFLRDYGVEVENIRSTKLAPINSLFNNACNGSIRCHMACIRPTGGLDTWSSSSIDAFDNIVKNYESLGATLQGKRKGNSLPVILWGLKINICDPLAPTIHKWININKSFVNSGLAHMSEKFDTNSLISINDKLTIENEIIQEEQKPISDWVNNFLNDAAHILNYSDNDKTDELIISENENFADCSELGDIESLKSDVTKNITNWCPARPIKKSVFTGYPTYIDDKGIIYLHDVKREAFLCKMREMINKNVQKLEKPKPHTLWLPKQPCLALYHLDNSFYRATVIKSNDNNITVQFVDYGNIEECQSTDLRKDIIFGYVPIQATKYQIDGVIPINANDNCTSSISKDWTTDVLDFIHSKIVGKMCTIRVSPNQINETIKKCSIRCENYDLGDLLLEENFAKRMTNTLKVSSSPDSPFLKAIKKTSENVNKYFNEDCNENMGKSEDDENIIEIPDDDDNNKPTNNKVKMDNEDYKKLFEKLEIKKLSKLKYRKLHNSSDSEREYNTNDNDVDDDDDDNDTFTAESIDMIELEYTYQFDEDKDSNDCSEDDDDRILSGGGLKNLNLNGENETDNQDEVASSTSFNPKETSSVKTPFDGMEKFRPLEILSNVNGFYGEVSFIHDSTTLFVYPYMNTNQKQYDDMFKKLQSIVNQLPQMTKFDSYTPCLAQYNCDNLWYRALIRSYYPSKNQVDVVYVDFLNAEMINTSQLRKLPKYFLNIPLRNVQLKLYDVKPNPRYRECDIQRELCEIINDRKIYCKIIKNCKIPKVILYHSQSEDKIVYEKLIKERFFLKK